MQFEADLVANMGSKRYHIQSTQTVSEENKRQQGIIALSKISDSFKIIVVIKCFIAPGIMTMAPLCWHQSIFYQKVL